MESDVNTLGSLVAQLASLSQTLVDTPTAGGPVRGPADGAGGPGSVADDAAAAGTAGPAASASAASGPAAPPVDVQTLELRRAKMTAVRAAVDGAVTVLNDAKRYLIQEDDFAEINPDTYQPMTVRPSRSPGPAPRPVRLTHLIARPRRRLRVPARSRSCTSSPSTTAS